MKTFVLNKESAERKWHHIDAKDQCLGRLATRIADLLRGKGKATYTPYVDSGDFVVVTNVDKIKVTGRKEEQKKYYQHSGYPGGLRVRTLKEMRQKHPDRILKKAVWGMLPKNRLGRKQLTKLKLYVGAEHPHQAQKPERISLG